MMYRQHFQQKSRPMDQPGMIGNPARDQLKKRENLGANGVDARKV